MRFVQDVGRELVVPRYRQDGVLEWRGWEEK